MAKPTKTPASNDGPYLGFAVICERFLKEADGVPSLIRVIDKLTVSSMVPSIPLSFLAFILAVRITSGRAKGTKLLQICGVDPKGAECVSASQSIDLGVAGQPGVNVEVGIQLAIAQAGTYWFSVTLDGHLLSKIPLIVEYQQLTAGKAQTPSKKA
jgi:hypothetical protein